MEEGSASPDFPEVMTIIHELLRKKLAASMFGSSSTEWKRHGDVLTVEQRRANTGENSGGALLVAGKQAGSTEVGQPGRAGTSTVSLPIMTRVSLRKIFLSLRATMRCSSTPNTIMDMASLADLEARVAALEADRADYRAVLAAVGALAGRVSGAEVKIDAHREAVNALGEKVAGFQAEVRQRFDSLDRNREEDRGEAAAFRRSVEDGQAELKDLVLQAQERRSGQ
jgi:hypothetical protein